MPLYDPSPKLLRGSPLTLHMTPVVSPEGSDGGNRGYFIKLRHISLQLVHFVAPSQGSPKHLHGDESTDWPQNPLPTYHELEEGLQG